MTVEMVPVRLIPSSERAVTDPLSQATFFQPHCCCALIHRVSAVSLLVDAIGAAKLRAAREERSGKKTSSH